MSASEKLHDCIGSPRGSSDSNRSPSGPSLAKSEAERRLVRKLDVRIMTIICAMNIFALMDRINISNARLQGLPQDILHGDPTGVLFGWAYAAFYLPFIISHVPAVLLFKRSLPHIWLGCVAIAWGSCSMLTAATFDFAGIMVARFALGICQAGFSPACPVYFALFYTREEAASRNAYWFGTMPLASCIGGLVAFGIQHAQVAIANWRLLFIVEGIPPVLIGLVALLLLPDRPEKTRILEGKERELALERITRGHPTHISSNLNRRHVIAGLTDWKVYAFGAILFSEFCGTASLAGFLPTIITTFGYSKAAAQILTVPPAIVALIVPYLCLRASNWLQIRGPFIVANGLLSGMGFMCVLLHDSTPVQPNSQYDIPYFVKLMMAVESNVHVRYFGAICAATGIAGTVNIMTTWYAHNLGSESKKAAGVALSLTIGHCGDILGAHLFPSTEGPRYMFVLFYKGFAIAGALQFLAAFVAGILHVYYLCENSRRDRKYGKPGATVDTSELADEAPEYRYMP